jgi:hypothetical protein
MKVIVHVTKRKRRLFESILSGILPLSYQVDIMSNHTGEKSKYEIPYETENQRKTIITLLKAI